MAALPVGAPAPGLARASGDPELKAALHLAPGEARKVIDGEHWQALVQSNVEAHRAQQIADSRRLIREAKREAASTRGTLARQVVDLAHTQRRAGWDVESTWL